MDKLRAYVVEDEKHNRDLLIAMLEQHCGAAVDVIGASGSTLEAAEFLNKHHADLLFLDIELADGQVFDLLQDIAHSKYRLIFVTGYAEHAIRAIKFSAADYLLKPVRTSELVAAVNKVSAAPFRENQVLDDFISRKTFDLPNYLVVNNLHIAEKIELERISHLEAQGIYTVIYHENTRTVSSKPLGVYEDMLPGKIFNRCHRSFIVNRFFVKRVHKTRRMELTLHSGIVLPVSVRKRESFNDWFRQ